MSSSVPSTSGSSAPVKSWAALAKSHNHSNNASSTTASSGVASPPANSASSTKNGSNAPSAAAAAAAAAATNPPQQQPTSSSQPHPNGANPSNKSRIAKKKNKHPAVDGGGANNSSNPSASSAQSKSAPTLSNDSASPSDTASTHPSTNSPVLTSSAHSSQPNSPNRSKRKNKHLNQSNNNANQPHSHNSQTQSHPHHPPAGSHPQQIPQQPMPFPFYPQGFNPGMRPPFPGQVPLGPNGLPIGDFIGATGGVGPIGMNGFGPQFPMAFPMPLNGVYPVQGGKGRGGAQFPPQQFYGLQNSQGVVAPTLPTPAPGGAAPLTVGRTAQPFVQPFGQMGYTPAAAAAAAAAAGYSLAYQMGAMNLGQNGAPFMPIAGPVGPSPVYPATGAPAPINPTPASSSSSVAAPSSGSSSSSSSSSSTPPIPPFPTPFAPSPFEDLLNSTPLPYGDAPYYSVDVECVATGPGHNDRAVGHVAVVDQIGQIVLNMYIKPTKPVTSYLPALTGLSEKDLANGITLDEAIALFRSTIPSNAILVGQNVLKDVEWLHLVEGEDFASMLDLAGLFAAKNPKFSGLTFFSLAHEAKALLCLDQKEQHHPAIDAWLSIKLYQLYTLLQSNPSELNRAKQLLLDLPVESGFASKYPVYEGVCMGSKKLCQCKQPWFF